MSPVERSIGLAFTTLTIFAPLAQAAHPQQAIIAQDYCMDDGKISIPIRKSFLYYFQKRLRFDVAKAIDNLRETPVVIQNIAEFEQARKINAKDDRVYRGFGQVLMIQKKYALASQVLGEAARLSPSDPGILLMRATALIEHAIAINPLASKEAAAERESAFGMAEKSLAQAFELSGKKLAAVHLQLARLYEKKGDRARAADELGDYLKMAPDDKKADAIRAAIKTLRDPAAERKPPPQP